MLLLAALLIAAVLAWYKPDTGYQADSVTTLTYMNTGFALLIILTGALVRGSGATLACTEWPLCNNGLLLPFEQGQLAVIHMIHRLAVGALGVTILILIWQVMKNRSEPLVRQIAIAVGFLYLLQAGVGALFVLSVAESGWGAAHVGLAATTWGLLIILSVVEMVNNRQIEISRSGTEWQHLSETASA
jgi:cytochrome c oxidase assembly protein subunit 15